MMDMSFLFQLHWEFSMNTSHASGITAESIILWSLGLVVVAVILYIAIELHFIDKADERREQIRRATFYWLFDNLDTPSPEPPPEDYRECGDASLIAQVERLCSKNERSAKSE